MKQRTLKLQRIYKEGSAYLESRQIPDAQIDAWYLLEYVTGISRASYYGNPEKNISEEEAKRYWEYLEKRARRIPLQHITGSQEFMGYEFLVNEHVLIPRQDTETLVEEALKVVRPGMRVLDLCTGSGCVIVSILHNVSDVEGYAVDISKQALNVAKENARLNDVPVLFEHSDLFDHVTGTFDVIVSNPPYICTDEIAKLMPEVRDFEPMEALDGKEDGLYFYRRITEESVAYLKPGGYLLYEIGHDQGEAVSSYMRENGFDEIEVIRDLAGLDRVVRGRR